MNTDPVAFIREDFVRLFNLGAAQYKERGEGGDEKAKARYEDIAAARGKVFVSFEGDGGADLWLAVENGVMAIHDAEPEGLPPRMAIAAPSLPSATACSSAVNVSAMSRRPLVADGVEAGVQRIVE